MKWTIESTMKFIMKFTNKFTMPLTFYQKAFFTRKPKIDERTSS